MNVPLSVAIVGSGIIAHNHAEAIARHPRLRTTAVVDPVAAASASLADHVADLTGGPPPGRYPTLTAALADRAVDLVVVCGPSGTHAEVAEEALAAGAHVVVEKPPDATLARARRLARLATEAEKRGQVCSVISQHRFDPASVAVARAVADGRLGRLTSAVASVAWWRGQDYYDSAPWRGTWELDGGGAAMNQGIHTVDLLVWLLGQPAEVFGCTGLLCHDRVEVEDVAVATVRFASGALAVLHATTAAYPGLAVRLQVHGSRGSAVIHDDQLEYFHAAGDAPAERANQATRVVPAGEIRGVARAADSFVVGHLRQYGDIVDAIERGRPAAVRVDDALLAFAVVKAVYVSATLRRPVAVGDVLDGGFDDVRVTTS
ncbi:Gfo/Idh/MocA family protein [Planosporangium sp. 12N6]|uniref:Gfo/Idh/MocA family protein n=1 Tax=Planosporangium spinosum TaxID=3402278 RepID=UPI003CF9D165